MFSASSSRHGRHGSLVGALAALTLAGCSSVRPVEIRTEPEGAEVAVDDEVIGTSPVVYGFDFDDPDALYKVTAEKEGYVPARKRVSQLHLDAALESRQEQGEDVDGQEYLVIGIDEDESWTRTAPSRAANAWVELMVDPQLGEEQVWEVLVDTVTKYYPELANLDNQAGYIAAKEKVKRFQRGPTATVQVKNQFFCSMTSGTPLVYKVKIESKLNEGGKWETFPRVFEDDAQLIDELESRLTLQE